MGILRVITSLAFAPRWMNGSSERGSSVCGCREERESGCVAFLLVWSYEEFAQIVYSSLGV